MNFAQSKTHENLMRAFAGECMARTRYDNAAQTADGEGLFAVGRVFRFTAGQEREHAELFCGRLAPAAGGPIHIAADYPAQPAADTLRLLTVAAENEYAENAAVYPGFALIADEEGFPDIARLFERVAQIERTHGDRFAALARLLGAGALFHAQEGAGWVCLNCGHTLTGADAPLSCPVCGHAQGFFTRAGGDTFPLLAGAR